MSSPEHPAAAPGPRPCLPADPLARSGARIGDRVSLRHRTGDGLATDVIGYLLALDDNTASLHRTGGRAGERVTVSRGSLLAVRVVPAIARGRSPHGFAADDVAALVRRTVGDAVDAGATQRLRLSDLITTVTFDPPECDGPDFASHRGGRAWPAGEWSVLQLDPSSTGPATEHPAVPVLASWLVLRGCRNVVLVTPRDGSGPTDRQDRADHPGR